MLFARCELAEMRRRERLLEDLRNARLATERRRVMHELSKIGYRRMWVVGMMVLLELIYVPRYGFAGSLMIIAATALVAVTLHFTVGL